MNIMGYLKIYKTKHLTLSLEKSGKIKPRRAHGDCERSVKDI